jgi:uncharacterized protein YyaL (SSP411 family)
MLQNILKIASLKADFRYEKIAQDSLDQLKHRLQEKQSDAPALAKAYLMQKLGIITLKSSQKNLLQNRNLIVSIRYPYLLTKAVTQEEYLACTLRQCFIADKNIQKIIDFIESYIRK